LRRQEVIRFEFARYGRFFVIIKAAGNGIRDFSTGAKAKEFTKSNGLWQQANCGGS
jgi:hypothetical protein